MKCLITTLVFCIILMTKANATFVEVRPLSEHLLLFDVISFYPETDLQSHLTEYDVRHFFKITGTSRYIVVVATDGTNETNQISFPPGVLVTQYPVEHLADYYRSVGMENWPEWANDGDLKEENLIMLECDIITLPETTEEELESTMYNLASEYFEVQKNLTSVTYVVLNSQPIKFFCFMNMEDNQSQELLRSSLDILGGPAAVLTKFNHIVKI